jgi:WD40 repeat protein
VNGAAFSPDGRTLATASFDGTIKLTDLTTPDPPAIIQADKEMAYWWNIVFSPDSRWIVAENARDIVRVFDTVDGKTVASYQDQGSIGAAYFTPDARYLVWPAEGSIRQWEWQANDSQPQTIASDVDSNWLELSSDFRWLVGNDTDKIRVWDWPSLKPKASLAGHPAQVWTVGIFPDGLAAVTGSQDTSIKLWNLRTGAETRTLRGHTDALNAIAISPDGKLFASSGIDPNIRLWQYPSGELIRILRGHSDNVPGLKFSPDGKILASASDDRTVHLWDVSTGAERAAFATDIGPLRDVAFSPNGKILAASGIGPGIHIWRTDN